VPQQVPKGRKGKKRKAEEDDSDAEEDLAAAAAAKGIPVMNGQPVMCFMAPHLVSRCRWLLMGGRFPQQCLPPVHPAVLWLACFHAQLACTVSTAAEVGL
jgi:hypothetical protein